MGFAKFMASTAGRLLRIALGAGLIAAGYFFGLVPLMLVGVLPVLAGAFNICVIAPLLGVPFSGNKVTELRA